MVVCGALGLAAGASYYTLKANSLIGVWREDDNDAAPSRPGMAPAATPAPSLTLPRSHTALTGEGMRGMCPAG